MKWIDSLNPKVIVVIVWIVVSILRRLAGSKKTEKHQAQERRRQAPQQPAPASASRSRAPSPVRVTPPSTARSAARTPLRSTPVRSAPSPSRPPVPDIAPDDNRFQAEADAQIDVSDFEHVHRWAPTRHRAGPDTPAAAHEAMRDAAILAAIFEPSRLSRIRRRPLV